METTNSYFTDENSTKYNANNINIFKTTSINKSKFVEYFGTDGYIDIKDNNGVVIQRIDNNTEADENGIIVINYDGEKTDIKIETLKPIKQGEFTIQNTKAIKGVTGYSKNTLKNINKLYTNEKISTDTQSSEAEASIDLLDTKTEAKEDNLDNFSEVLNQKKYIRLSGYVWEDKNVRDNLYNSKNDKLVKNVTVRLKDKDGNIVNFKTKTGETINHLKVLPDGRVFIEADQEIIQSATLKVTYAISVNTKKAEIDYNSQDYYIYGTVPNNNEGWRIATITRLYDYLSNELAFDDTNADNTSTWTDIKISSDMVTEGYLSEDVYKELKKYNRIFQTNR